MEQPTAKDMTREQEKLLFYSHALLQAKVAAGMADSWPIEGLMASSIKETALFFEMIKENA